MKKFLFGGWIVLLMSCEDGKNCIELPAIDSKILVEAREVLEPGSRSIALRFQTEKIYTCINYQLLMQSQLDEHSFKVNFTGVSIGMLCLTALGPAVSGVDLNQLRDGVYPLELSNGGIKDIGTLTVDQQVMRLDFSKQEAIEIVRPVTRRVPAHTYWGTIGYHTESSIGLVNDYLEQLESQGAIFAKQTPGDYFYYKIDEDGEITDPELSGYHFVKTIIFQYDGDEAELKKLIKSMGAAHREELSVYIQTYKGEELSNWIE